jgi:hypothetical protein
MAGFGYNASVFRDMWIATRTRFEKKVLNTLQREHPLLDKISGKGNFQAKEGGSGKRNVETVLTGNNNNVKYVAFNAVIGAPELNLLAQLEWDWKFMYKSFQVLDKVLEMSRTDELVNLLEQYQEATRKGFQEHLAKQLYAYGGESAVADDTRNLEIGGLRYLLSDNPYGWLCNIANPSAGTTSAHPQYVFNLRRDGAPGDIVYVGGVASKALFQREWWRNRIAAFRANFGSEPGDPYLTDCAALVRTMRRMRRVLSNGENGLDGIYCGYDMYEMYLNYLDNKRTFYVERRSPDKLDAAYSSLEFDGIPIYADKYCPPGRMYFINSDYLHFKYLEGQNFKQEIRQVYNQWAKMYITTFIGNLILTKPHSCGVIYIGAKDGAGTVPDSVWNGIFTDNTCVNYRTAAAGGCTYNMADDTRIATPADNPWLNFIDYDYGFIKPVPGNMHYETAEQTGFSGSGVYMGDNFNPVIR